MAIGEPVVTVVPSFVMVTPERISTISDSSRGVVIRDWPGRRRSRSRWMSVVESERRGGHPSSVTPMPAPCDSPHVEIRKMRPKVLPDDIMVVLVV